MNAWHLIKPRVLPHDAYAMRGDLLPPSVGPTDVIAVEPLHITRRHAPPRASSLPTLTRWRYYQVHAATITQGRLDRILSPIKMADINLQKIHDDLVAIAYEAGSMIMAANPNSISTGTKLNCKATIPPLPTPPPFSLFRTKNLD